MGNINKIENKAPERDLYQHPAPRKDTIFYSFFHPRHLAPCLAHR